MEYFASALLGASLSSPKNQYPLLFPPQPTSASASKQFTLLLLCLPMTSKNAEAWSIHDSWSAHRKQKLHFSFFWSRADLNLSQSFSQCYAWTYQVFYHSFTTVAEVLLFCFGNSSHFHLIQIWSGLHLRLVLSSLPLCLTLHCKRTGHVTSKAFQIWNLKRTFRFCYLLSCPRRSPSNQTWSLHARRWCCRNRAWPLRRTYFILCFDRGWCFASGDVIAC